jgi:hypothetical protein
MSASSLEDLSDVERQILRHGDSCHSFTAAALVRVLASDAETVGVALRTLWIKLLILRGSMRAGCADRFHLTLEGKRLAKIIETVHSSQSEEGRCAGHEPKKSEVAT